MKGCKRVPSRFRISAVHFQIWVVYWFFVWHSNLTRPFFSNLPSAVNEHFSHGYKARTSAINSTSNQIPPPPPNLPGASQSAFSTYCCQLITDLEETWLAFNEERLITSIYSICRPFVFWTDSTRRLLADVGGTVSKHTAAGCAILHNIEMTTEFPLEEHIWAQRHTAQSKLMMLLVWGQKLKWLLVRHCGENK